MQCKNGMRYIPSHKIKEGFHFHEDISAKIGKNAVRVLYLKGSRLGAGKAISLKTKLSTINHVKLNNFILTPHLDYVIRDEDNTIEFTFNLTSNDKIEIEGFI